MTAPLASEILDHAAVILGEWGLYKENCVNPQTGAMCEIGALAASGGRHEHYQNSAGFWQIEGKYDFWPAYMAALDYLNRVNGGVAHSYVATTRTAVAKLKEAAKLARSEGK